MPAPLQGLTVDPCGQFETAQGEHGQRQPEVDVEHLERPSDVFGGQCSPFSYASSQKSSVHCPAGSIAELSREISSKLRTSVTHSSLDSLPERKAQYGPLKAEKPPSKRTAVASAIINFLLMFGLCCAYGVIMFGDDWNAQHRGLGVKMNLGTSFIVGLSLSFFSGVKVAMGGPDLNPVVFISMFIETIAESLAEEHGIPLPEAGGRTRRLDVCRPSLEAIGAVEVLRRLEGVEHPAASEWCRDAHYEAHSSSCDDYHAQLRATSVFAVMVSSALLGMTFFVLGRFRLTRLVAFLPSNIMEAFLSCIGYKVFKYALKFCDFQPIQFMPAIAIGVPLYFVKALHLGNPAIVIPSMLLLPIAVFYLVVPAANMDMGDMRSSGWMFTPVLENARFSAVWTETFVGRDGSVLGDVNISAWLKSLPDLPIMIVVCTMDCLLKLHGTEGKLPVKVDKDAEIKLYGMTNVFTTLGGGTVGYMQLKFNIINAGMMGNVLDRRGGFLYAVLCGACFFGTTELFNWMPRFFLSALLFFAGAGFVAENLWGSRKYLNTWEWIHILVIVGIFVAFESLLYAVIVGGVIAGLAFVVRYARVPCFTKPVRGGYIVSSERRQVLLQNAVRHVNNSWLVVMRLKGFIFFASAQKLTATVEKLLQQQDDEGIPPHRRLRWVLFDSALIDGLDASASKSFGKLVATCLSKGVSIIWAALPSNLELQLRRGGTLTGRENECFSSLDEAMRYIERNTVNFISNMQDRWICLHPRFALAHSMLQLQGDFEPFREILPDDSMRFGMPWEFCGRLEIRAFRTLLWRPGDSDRELFLIHSGAVGLFTNIPSESGQGEWGELVAIYRHGWFLNRGAVCSQNTRHFAVALEDGECLFWNDYQWSRMRRERPAMAAGFLRTVLRQEALDAKRADSGKVFQEDDGVPVRRSRAPKPRTYPDLERILHDMKVARRLSELGLFKKVAPDEAAIFPLLPDRIKQDLDIAWRTYSRFGSGATIPMQQVGVALMYAGIFNVLLTERGQEPISRSSFMQLAYASVMMQFSLGQVATCEDLFNSFDKAGQGILNSEDLADLFKEAIHTDIEVEEVDGIQALWADGSSGKINLPLFVAIMSRFVKRHEVHWHVLCGLEHLMGREIIKDSDQITLDMLVDTTKLDEEEAEEMLWAADFCNENSCCTAVDHKLIAAVVLEAPHEPRALPPMPRIPTGGCSSEALLDFPRPAKSPLVIDARDFDTKDELTPYLTTLASDGYLRSLEEESDDVKSNGLSNEVEEPWQLTLHLLLEEPTSSVGAKRVSMLMGGLIMSSVLTLFLEPLVTPPDGEATTLEATVWFSFELFFTCVFSIEFCLRLAVSDARGTQTKCGFLRTPMNISDAIAILPFFVDLILKDMDPSSFRLFRVARLARLSRVVRLGRLAKMSAQWAPVAMISVVIWGIYMKNGLGDT